MHVLTVGQQFYGVRAVCHLTAGPAGCHPTQGRNVASASQNALVSVSVDDLPLCTYPGAWGTMLPPSQGTCTIGYDGDLKSIGGIMVTFLAASTD